MSTVMGSSLAANAIDVDIYARGEAGRGIEEVTRKYQYTTDGQNYPTTGTWSDSIPAVQKGKYLWTQVTENYTDGTTDVSYNVTYLGTDGVTPIIAAANGSDIATVGTPSVTASTSGNTTTFTFHKVKGATGSQGNPGVSPVITSSKSGKTTTLSITDVNGGPRTLATIQDGLDGTGVGDMLKSVYDTDNDGIVDNAEKVNNHSVNTDVPSNAVFTDHTYTAGAGLTLDGSQFKHSNSVTGATIGTSSATSGNTINIPYFTFDNQGHITGGGTHTHTNSDTNNAVTQNIEGNTNKNYPILFKNTNNSTVETAGVKFKSEVYINSTDNSINAAAVNATTITQNGVAVSTNAVLYGSADPTSGQGKIGDIYVQISS